MFSATFLKVFAAGEALVVLQALFSWFDGMLTPTQMRASGYDKGLPFLGHGGMWSDVVIVSPLIAAAVALYGATWSPDHIVVAVFVGLVCSILMHLTYLGAKYPEAHVQFGELTTAGMVHVFYMAVAFAVLFLLYFGTVPLPASWFLWMTSVLLVIHIAVGTHVVLGIVKPTWYAGDPLHSWGTWIPIAAAAVSTFGWTAHLVL